MQRYPTAPCAPRGAAAATPVPDPAAVVSMAAPASIGGAAAEDSAGAVGSAAGVAAEAESLANVWLSPTFLRRPTRG